MPTPAELQARLDASPVSCNSFVVVRKATGEAVLETYSPETAAAINLDKYEVLTAYEYLTAFNRKLKESRA